MNFHAFFKAFRFWSLIFWLTLPFSVFCSGFNFHILNYNVTDGLPSSETYDVFQDSKGFIWVGTDKGVAKFDGKNFTTFTTNDGLADNTIFKFYEDYKKRIWFISYERKLSYLENDTIKTYPFNDKLVNHLSNVYIGNVISHFEISNDGVLTLLVSSSQGVQITPQGEIEDFKPTYANGLFKAYHNSTNIEELRKQLHPILTHEFTGNAVRGKLNRLTYFNYEKHNNQWLELGRNGVTFLNNANFQPEYNILPEYFVTGYSQDFEGGMWFSTLNHGLMYIPKPILHLFTIDQSAKSDKLQGFLMQDGELIARYPNNIMYTLSSSDIFSTTNHWDLVKNENNVTAKGVKFENALLVSPLSKPSKSIIKHNDSTWIYASNALSYVYATQSSSTNKIVEKGFVGPKINRISQTKDGMVWLGTTKGLMQMGKDSLPQYVFPKTDSLSKISIQDIAILPDSTFVFASRVNGLIHRKNDSNRYFNQHDGLVSNTINQISFDSIRSLLWVATPRGITAITWENQKLSRMRYFIGASSGLKSTDIRQFFVKDDVLYFGSESGLNSINIKDLAKTQKPPYLYLNHININDSTLRNLTSILLNHKENTLNFNFTGISFNSFDRLKYHFFMTGLNNNWNSTLENSVSFYNLSPGKYIFNLMAENTHGGFSKRISIPIEIKPAFWMTWWFRLVVILILLFIGFLGLREFIKRFKTKAQLQIDIQHLKSMNLQSKMNPHFIFNSLNSIQHYIIGNNPMSANEYLIDFSRLIRKVLNNSFSPTITLSEDLDTINLYVTLEQRRLPEAFQFNMLIDPEIDTDNCMIPSLLIQPFIENAIWHGNLKQVKNGELELRIQLKNEKLYFEIEDNGLGYSETIKAKSKQAHRSMGAKVTEERIQVLSRIDQHLSKIEITPAQNFMCTAPNKGTLIKFSTSYNLK